MILAMLKAIISVVLSISLFFTVAASIFGIYMIYLIAITIRDEITQIEKILKVNRTTKKESR